MKILKTQFGSIILQQLAVLAVAGILTVGGVYLYSEVSARFQADNIKSEAMLRATSVLSSTSFLKADLGAQLLAPGFKRDSSVVTFTQTKRSAGSVIVSASHVRKKVCEKLRNAPVEKNLLSIYINCTAQDISQCYSTAQGGAAACNDDRDNTISFLIGKRGVESAGNQPDEECPQESMPSSCAMPEAYSWTSPSGVTKTCTKFVDNCQAPRTCFGGVCGCPEHYQWDGDDCVPSACPKYHKDGVGCVECLEGANCPKGQDCVNGECTSSCSAGLKEKCPSCDERTPYWNGKECVCVHNNDCGAGYTCMGGACTERCDQSACESYLKTQTDDCCSGWFCDTGTDRSMIGRTSESGTCHPVRYKRGSTAGGQVACSKDGDMNYFDAALFCTKLGGSLPSASFVQANLEFLRETCGDLASLWVSEAGMSDTLGWYVDLGDDSTTKPQTLSASSGAMHALCYKNIGDEPFPECLDGASCGDGKICSGGQCECPSNAYPDGDSCVECPVGWKPVGSKCECADPDVCCSSMERVVTVDGVQSCEDCLAGFEPNAQKTECQPCDATLTQTCATCTNPAQPYWDGGKCVAPVNCTNDDECAESEVCITASSKCTACSDGTWRNNNCGGTPCTSGTHCALTGVNKWGWLTGLYCSSEGAGQSGGRAVNVVIGTKQYTYTYFDKGKHTWFESYNICEAMGASMPPASEVSQNYQAISQALGQKAYVWTSGRSLDESDHSCKAQVVSLSTGEISTAQASANTTNFITVCRMAEASAECKYDSEYCGNSGDCCAGAVCMNHTCEPCPVNTYRSDNQCLPCVEGSTSLEGSAECTCAAGSVWDKETNTCRQCEANTYQSGQECLPCEGTSTAVAGSAQCVCADGYYLDEDVHDCRQCTLENAKEKCTGVRCTNQTHCGGVGSMMFCDNASTSGSNVSWGRCAATGAFAQFTYSASRDQTAVNNGVGTALLGSREAAEAVLGGHFVISEDRMKLGSAWGWCQAFGLTLATKAQLGDPTYAWKKYAQNAPIVHALGVLYNGTVTVLYHPIHPSDTGFNHDWMIIIPVGDTRYDFSPSTGYSSHAICYDPDGTPPEEGCLSHTDCPEGYFCRYPNPTSGTCVETAEARGTCSPVGSKVEKTIPGWGKVYRSSITMSYWQAKDWCEAQGDRLVDLSGNPLHCWRNGSAISAPINTYCCNLDTPTCSSNIGTQSAVMQALRSTDKGFGSISTAMWSGTRISTSSCGSQWSIRTSDGYVYSLGRTNSAYALCFSEKDSSCRTYADCASGQYCHYDAPANACSLTPPSYGTCQGIGESKVRTIANLGKVTRGWMGLNWWSTKDWCAAQGLRQLSASDLHCYANNSTILLDLTNQEVGYCRKPKTTYGTVDHLSDVARPMLTADTGYGTGWARSMWTNTPFDACKGYILNNKGQLAGEAFTALQHPTCVAP